MISNMKTWMFGVLALGAVDARAMVGTNAGGLFVLEPWITPSLFYRFLGKGQGDVGVDSYTMCETLGPIKGNKLMRAHWDAWFTANDFKNLQSRGVEIIRLPIGDWTLNPYGPYIGCMDGAAEKIDWFYDQASLHNIKILLDVHAMRGSQNGYDNSGQATDFEWIDHDHFSHWPIQAARWFGDWNRREWKYDHINFSGMNWGLRAHESMLQRWGAHSAFYAFEPVNEPQFNPLMDELGEFYKRSRKLVQKYTANAWFVMHNAFDRDPRFWNKLFRDDDMDKIAVDVHHYQAFMGPPNFKTAKDSCDEYETVMSEVADRLKYPVWVGEWSLATDVCATWLGGFNDANTHSQYTCNWNDCPKTYLPPGNGLGTDFDRTTAQPGPWGPSEFSAQANIQYGKCSSDSSFFDENDIKQIAKCAMQTFDKHTAAQFLWTAHNEIEAKWDYVSAWDLGWINTEPVSIDNQLQYNHATGQAEYMNGTIVTRAFNGGNAAVSDEKLTFLQE